MTLDLEGLLGDIDRILEGGDDEGGPKGDKPTREEDQEPPKEGGREDECARPGSRVGVEEGMVGVSSMPGRGGRDDNPTSDGNGVGGVNTEVVEQGATSPSPSDAGPTAAVVAGVSCSQRHQNTSATPPLDAPPYHHGQPLLSDPSCHHHEVNFQIIATKAATPSRGGTGVGPHETAKGDLERLWWPQRSAARQWWRYGRQHRLQRWFGLDHFLLLMPLNYSRRLLVGVGGDVGPEFWDELCCSTHPLRGPSTYVPRQSSPPSVCRMPCADVTVSLSLSPHRSPERGRGQRPALSSLLRSL